jgi:hypothetical protein
LLGIILIVIIKIYCITLRRWCGLWLGGHICWFKSFVLFNFKLK